MTLESFITEAKSVENTKAFFALSEISLISLLEIKLNNSILKITFKAVEDLLEILGIERQDVKKLKTLDESYQSKIVNQIKQCISLMNNKKVAVYINQECVVTKIMASKLDFMNLDYALKVTENVFNQLDIKDITSYTVEGDSFKLSFREKKSFEIKNFKDEKYDLGKRISFETGKGVLLENYTYRLVCSNGMYGFKYGIIGKLEPRPTQKLIMDFLKQSENHEKLDFITNFIGNFNDHSQNLVSAKELLGINQMIKLNINIDSLDKVHRYLEIINVTKRIEEHYKKDYKSTLQYVRTPFNSWDTINKLTYIGSHPEEFSISSNEGFLVNEFATKLMTKKPDLATYKMPKQLY